MTIKRLMIVILAACLCILSTGCTFGPTRTPTRTPRPTTPTKPTKPMKPTKPTSEPTTPEPTEEPTTPEPTEEPTTPEPTEEPTTPEPTEEPTTPEPTEEPTITPYPYHDDYPHVPLPGVHWWYAEDTRLIGSGGESRGWNLEHIPSVGACDRDSSSDPFGVKAKAEDARNHGLKNIIRIDYIQAQGGSMTRNLAVPAKYSLHDRFGFDVDVGTYSSRIDNWAQKFIDCTYEIGDSADIYIVGNEPNIESGNMYGYNGIPPLDYAEAFNELYKRKNEMYFGDNTALLATGNAPFHPPEDWMSPMTSNLDFVDGFAIHTGGGRSEHTSDKCPSPGNPTLDCRAPDSWNWDFDAGFHYYRSLIQNIHSKFWDKPIFITEFNPFWGDEHEIETPLYLYSQSWVVDNWINEAFTDVRNYNATRGALPRIKALIWFVHEPRGWADWSLIYIPEAWTDMCNEFGGISCNIFPDFSSRILIEEEGKGVSTVPAFMNPGDTRQVSIVVENTGNIAWASGLPIRLVAGSTNEFEWSNITCDGGASRGISDVQAVLCSDEVVEPTDTYTFTFDITAPNEIDSTNLSMQMMLGDSPLGDGQTWVIPVIEHYDAEILDGDIPRIMIAGETRQATISVMNTGSETWPGGGEVGLGIPGDSPIVISGSSCGGADFGTPEAHVSPCEEVNYEGTTEFIFDITAPETGGEVTLSLQMTNGDDLFGDIQKWVVPVIEPYDAEILDGDIPRIMIAGETRQATISVMNTGSETWPDGGDVGLGIPGDSPIVISGSSCGGADFGTPEAHVSPCEEVNYEGTTEFIFDITAPETGGEVTLSLQMTKGDDYFGEVQTWTIDIYDGTGNNDALILGSDDLVPSSMRIGETWRLTIPVMNVGTNLWPIDQGYRLGADSSNEMIWTWTGTECGGMDGGTTQAQANLCDSVLKDEIYEFTFDITAPDTPGDAHLSLQMAHNGKWFGEGFSWTIPIIDAVVLEAESDVPASIIRGTTQQVTISVENTGSKPWTIEDLHRLGAYTDNQLTWSNLACGGTGSGTTDAQADLCSEFTPIEPGETHDFTFDITAPIALEPTTLSLCMLEDGEWFGEIQSWTIPVTCYNTSLPVLNDKWRMQIYNNETLSGDPVEWRYDFAGSGGFTSDFGSGRASECTGNDHFSIRYRRNANFSASDKYYFFTRTDEGVRLWVDENLIIDKWINQTPTSYTGSINLEVGWHDIRMEYYENAGGAYASLSWSDNKYPSCSCNNPGASNYCHHAPRTSGCPMTYPGGYCDPNGDGSYTDGNWDKGYWEWQDFCR